MLHLTTKLGEPGRFDLERRHFPALTNQPTRGRYRPRGRRFIDHGYCHDDDTLWKPHSQSLGGEPQYSENGPDWKSRLRYIPHPSNDDQKLAENENWPDPWFRLRTYPVHNRTTEKEWSAYPEGFHYGKVCLFQGVHKASSLSQREVLYDDVMGCNKKEPVIDKRNGLWVSSLGDKPYQLVEYSPEFHKLGSTLPIVNFGGPGGRRPDTFVPLQPLPAIRTEPYRVKEARRRQQEEKVTVASLEAWRPATPLVPAPTQEVRVK